MTGYTVHTGATKKFASGWERVFGGGGSGSSQQGVKPAAKKKTAAGKPGKVKKK